MILGRFDLTGCMTILYSFIRGSLEWTFCELLLSDASSWNQYKFIDFNIFLCTIVIIYCKILIITVISNKTTNELIIICKIMSKRHNILPIIASIASFFMSSRGKLRAYGNTKSPFIKILSNKWLQLDSNPQPLNHLTSLAKWLSVRLWTT